MPQIFGEKQTAITGIGQSAVGRKLGRPALELTVDACLDAIADAGLQRDDIDGLSTWPGRYAEVPGLSPLGAFDVKEALGLKLNWYSGGGESGQYGSFINAAAAIAVGLAKHVLIFRTVYEASTQTPERRASVVGGGEDRVSGAFSWLAPFKAFSAATWVGMYAQRHFATYGTTSEQMAQITLNARRNAILNPKAVLRSPMTLDDYLASRMISTPLRLFDCDIPVDGCCAVVMSRIDIARDLKNPPIRIEAVGSALHGRFSWDQPEDHTKTSAFDAARMMWARTQLKPADVDVAQLYDGFSFLTMIWLEALGFCGVGESGAFIADGTRIARDGVLPLNTGGGQLSGGRLHGNGLVHEACIQLWGRGGERQIPRKTEVAVAAAGGGPMCNSLLLVRES